MAGRGGRWSAWPSRMWAVAAPGFFLVPTSVDGLYERGLGLILCAIVCVLAWVFWTRGRRAHNRLDG